MAETMTKAYPFAGDAAAPEPPIGAGAESGSWESWPTAGVRLSALGNSEVHVWLLNLEGDQEQRDCAASHLDPGELARANRFRFPVHRGRYIATRVQTRILLAHYLHASPEDLDFVCGPAGKPALGPKWRKAGLEFNVSHSDDLALLAVCRCGPIGVDIERIRPLRDARDLVRRFFSPRENIAFKALAPEHQPRAFYNLWTRKEALLKGTGEGIAHSLNRVEVTFLPGEPARLLAAPGSFGVNRWQLCELLPIPGFAAALAVAHCSVQVSCRRWAAPVFTPRGDR